MVSENCARWSLCNEIESKTYAVRSLDIVKHRTLFKGSPLLKRSMTNGTGLMKNEIESRSGAVLHIDDTELHIELLARARYFVTFISEASYLVRALHMRAKSKAVGLMRGQMLWAERQTGALVKKIVLDCKKYLWMSKYLEMAHLEVFPTSVHTFQKWSYWMVESCHKEQKENTSNSFWNFCKFPSEMLFGSMRFT